MKFALSLCLIVAALDGRAREPALQKCAQMVDRYLADRLTVWKQRLRLEDWNISVVRSRSNDLRPTTLGNIRWDMKEKIAVIRVLDASEYDVGCRDMLRDMEFTVVHELIHLEFASLPRSEASRQEEEYAVNHIANALLVLDRHK